MDYRQNAIFSKKLLHLWPYMSNPSVIMVSKTWNPQSAI